MRKVLLLICFLFIATISIAQDFCALKQEADVLSLKKKYKKAAVLYNKAIEIVTSYKEEVLNSDWTEVSIASADNNVKLNKKSKPEYAFAKYGPNGDVFRNKIANLKARGLKCVFTYQIAGGMSISSYMARLPGRKESIFIATSNDRRILVWADKDSVFLQCFDNLNIHKPISIIDERFVDVCLNHFNKVINDKIKPRALKPSEQEWIEIIIPADTEGRYVKRFDYDDLVAPKPMEEMGRFKSWDDAYYSAVNTYQQNSQTYLAKLLPILLEQWRKNFVPDKRF
ncbi:MAG: hypothetical protein V4619_05060 [Bacteroidota bacterium]